MTATSITGCFTRSLVFVDSDILIHAHAAGPSITRERAAERLRRLWMTRDGRVSVQVLPECYVALCQPTGSGEAGASLIWSERLPDRQVIAGIRILYPLC